MWKDQLKLYLRETSAHGWKYLLVGQNIVEKVLWALVLLISFLLAFNMIVVYWMETDANPILTTVDTKLVTEIPFPSIAVDAGQGNKFMFLPGVIKTYPVILKMS